MASSARSHPSVTVRVQSMPMGTLLFILQAFAQVWHPMQRPRSMSIPSFVMMIT